ncbi:MAG: hypothetical protein DFNUSKGM_001216 [Candidatus Fervidibacter sacchari]
MYAALTLCRTSSHLLRVMKNAQGNPDQLVRTMYVRFSVASAQVKV